MIINDGNDYSENVSLENFNLSNFVQTSQAVVKVKSTNYDSDFTLTYNTDSSIKVSSEDLPEDFAGKLMIELIETNKTYAAIEGVVDGQSYQIIVLSYSENGQTIYP